jgi:hypothetical protein
MHTETTRRSGYWLGAVLRVRNPCPGDNIERETVVLAQIRCCRRRWLRHHESQKPQREERTPGRPLQPQRLLQHAAAAQQVPKEQQHEQQTDQSCSTGTRRI